MESGVRHKTHTLRPSPGLRGLERIHKGPRGPERKRLEAVRLRKVDIIQTNFRRLPQVMTLSAHARPAHPSGHTLSHDASGRMSSSCLVNDRYGDGRWNPSKATPEYLMKIATGFYKACPRSRDAYEWQPKV